MHSAASWQPRLPSCSATPSPAAALEGDYIPDWACAAVSSLTSCGVYPAGSDCAASLTRAEAAQMLLGAAQLALESGQPFGAMKDAVCSPGGTTIKGVAQLEKDGFRGSVIDAVDAIVG